MGLRKRVRMEDFDARVNRTSMEMEDSVNMAHKIIMTKPGISPSCLTAAGRAMMPAPTMVVERLNTAPENDEPHWMAASEMRFW